MADRDRVDEHGRAYAGSRLQIQTCVDRRPEELSQAVLDALPSLAALKPRLRWVSPLESEKFIEYRDRAFLRAISLGHLAKELSAFWPKRGPCWDALAVVESGSFPKDSGVLLVEAKSYPDEIYGPGRKATSPRSRKKIKRALEQTREWLNAEERADWTGRLYQSANRLAHLYFFREIAGVPAWLANVLFLDDPHSPTSREEWRNALEQVHAELSLTATVPYVADVFIAAPAR